MYPRLQICQIFSNRKLASLRSECSSIFLHCPFTYCSLSLLPNGWTSFSLLYSIPLLLHFVCLHCLITSNMFSDIQRYLPLHFNFLFCIIWFNVSPAKSLDFFSCELNTNFLFHPFVHAQPDVSKLGSEIICEGCRMCTLVCSDVLLKLIHFDSHIVYRINIPLFDTTIQLAHNLQ